MMRRYLTLAALLAATAAAEAGTLAPYEAGRINLGGVGGIAYYVEHPDGFHVIATLAEGETGTPVRFEATLVDGQKLTVSVPGRFGEVASQVELLRAGDRLVVDHGGESGASCRPGTHCPEG